ncbi:acyltransferase family protein [Citrobacter freundii]|uniref:acyltransferase family protein n=1 Tax=Citrobacter freundii TaxID=546 RepID=UPI00374EF730
MILSIQYLRGIASLLVVLFHYKFVLNDTYAQKDIGDLMFGNGYLGVDLFFMISGFVILASTEKDKSCSSFAIKRFFRIYPVYLFCLISYCVLMSISFTEGMKFIKALFLINLDYNAQAPWFGFSIVYTAWTLTYEIVFYLIFMTAMTINHKYRSAICSLIILSLYLLLNLSFNDGLHLSPNPSIDLPASLDNFGLLKILASPMMIEFIIGMLLYNAYSIVKKLDIQTGNRNSVLLIGMLLIVYFYSSGYNGGHGIANVGFYCLALLSCALYFEVKGGMPFIKPLNFLGNISYSLYLIHPVVMDALHTYSMTFPSYAKTQGFSKLLYMMSASIIISAIMYKYIELPFFSLARKIINKNPSTKAESVKS